MLLVFLLLDEVTEAVAEFAIAVLQTLNRRTHRAFNRVREATSPSRA